MLRSTSVFPAASLFGAGVGCILGPLAAWTLMRRVPIWKAIAGTAAGTTVGIGVGYALRSTLQLGVLWPLVGGTLGFVSATLILHVRGRDRGSRIDMAAG